MVRLFFYGTLRDADVLARVVGRAEAARLTVRPARAPGWRAVYAAGKRYPVLVPAARGAAPGVLVDGLGPRALRRLDAFEHLYRRARIAVAAGEGRVSAGVYLSFRKLRPGYRAFDLAAWQAASKARFLRRIGG